MLRIVGFAFWADMMDKRAMDGGTDGRRKEEGGRRKEEGGRRKEEGGRMDGGMELWQIPVFCPSEALYGMGHSSALTTKTLELA
jgi:hypothetical protein